VKESHPRILETIREKKVIDDDLKALLAEAIEDFKKLRWESYKA
jgi:hypothetical protein